MRSQTVKDENCLVSCTGLYADVSDDSFSKDLQQTLIKGDVSYLSISYPTTKT